MDPQTTLWAATYIDIRPTRCYPVASARVAIDGCEILYRSSWADPLLLRDRAEADSFIEAISLPVLPHPSA